MIVFVDELDGIFQRMHDWVLRESERHRLPLSGAKLISYLTDLTTLMFGEDCIVQGSEVIYKNSANINVHYQVRVSPNGMKQVREGVDLIQQQEAVFMIIYYPDEHLHHFVQRSIVQDSSTYSS